MYQVSDDTIELFWDFFHIFVRNTYPSVPMSLISTFFVRSKEGGEGLYLNIMVLQQNI